ncbi:hypothetical protein ACFYKX_11250 [Cytobacillus sp. FJAT-54145]|uniref:Uncharacterized protein n=1 Tax=Cytobacillus spartinae TaxID=3299023 RepID=A0ABW6KAI0_9BACI
MSDICMAKDCSFGGFVNLLDDGDKRMVLCLNHSAVYGMDPNLLEFKEGFPLPSEGLPNQACDGCGREGMTFMEKVPTEEDVVWNLCEEHTRKLFRRNLEPDVYHILVKKHGLVYMLHEDFYNPETGEAIQPIE